MYTYQLDLAFLLIAFGLMTGFLLRRVVRVYNYDLKEVPRLIGYSFLSSSVGGYKIRLSSAITAKAYTDNYLLVPDDFSMGWYEGIDVWVSAGDRACCVPLSDEMELSLR